MFRDSWVIAKKEIRLLFKSTRRIVLLFSTGLIIVGGGFLGGLVGIFMATGLESPVEVIVIEDDIGDWGNDFYMLLKTNNDTKDYEFINKSVTDLDNLLESSNFSVLLYIPGNFSDLIDQSLPAQFFLYYDNDDIKNEAAVVKINEIAALLNQALIYIEYGGPINLYRVYSLPKGTSKGLGAVVASTLTMVPMYAIFALVIPPLTLVLISVTIEREQKTLESLLLQPLGRKDIVVGKLFYGVILVAFNTTVSIGSILILLGGFYLIAPQDVKEEGIQILETVLESMGLSAWFFLIYFLIGLILVSVLMVSAAVFFSLMAKDEREANMVVSILIILPMISVLFFILFPLSSFPELIQLVIAAIPLLGYLFGVYISILAGEITLLAWSSLLFQIFWIIVVVWSARRLIQSEGILEISFRRLFSIRRK